MSGRIVPTVDVVAAAGGLSGAGSGQQAPGTDFYQIKAKLEPFREIFHILLEDAQVARISLIEVDTQTRSTGDGVTIYTLYEERSHHRRPRWAKGRAIFPPDTPTELQTAIMKQDTCDVSVLAFLPHITDALQKIDARVDWLCGYIKPRILIHYSDMDLEKVAMHSMFGITCSSGEQYIADFTIEQFGHDDDCWFTLKPDYLDRFVEDGDLRIATDDEIVVTEEDVAGDEFMSSLVVTVKTICEEIDWKVYDGLPHQERRAWMESRAKLIMQRSL
ncbi:hypothetical protein N0V83_007288 [Neocucurbitaria cava]|uniref:Uncharacterized protein n=1 Tax=Neocucurbitaria cava TaxID=798079 RepID=A0A9W8Y414_9PLEO|nr:hypothetical protein N0V83_007288 [Neocucurbitaria cava]